MMSARKNSPVPTNAASSDVVLDKQKIKSLMRRNNRSGLIWLSTWIVLLVLTGTVLFYSWGTVWVALALFCYGVAITLPGYALSHECAHGTAFRSRWINETCYWISSFIYIEEPTHRRYSHARHHTYTWHNESDSQMPFKTPMKLGGWLLEISGMGMLIYEIRILVENAVGRFSAITRDFTPDSELPRLKWGARIFLCLYSLIGILAVIGFDFLFWYFLLPRLVGYPILGLYALIQHVDMEEDQMDIRKSTRSFATNSFSRFLYMNMNFHIEHHLYPTVPFHALPRLSEALEGQLPEPDPGFVKTNWLALKAISRRTFGKLPMMNQGRSLASG